MRERGVRRVLLRELAVDDADHSREFPTLRFYPCFEYFQLIDRAASAVRNEEDVRSVQWKFCLDQFSRPVPAGEIAQTRVRCAFFLGIRQQNGRTITMSSAR